MEKERWSDSIERAPSNTYYSLVNKTFFYRISTFLLLLLSASSLHAETFSVGGIQFDGPKGWQIQNPSSPMRKAQFAIKGKDSKSAQVVFFHFGPDGGGGVAANVKRWLNQFKEPGDQLKARTVNETVNGTKVTYVTAEGTFMKGPPFGGNKVPVPNSGLLGAIIEGKQGSVFIKATGPKAIVKSVEKDMKALIVNALKK